MPPGDRPSLQLEVDGQQVEVADRGATLLEVLREDLGLRSAKDGCSPQGQCGCCTVLVDGQPRVACVTPARRVAGRSITTVDGLPEATRDRWADAFCATGASQCGFCTPGIVCRLEGAAAKGAAPGPDGHPAVEQALLAHLCRCTGWRTILDAWDVATGDAAPSREPVDVSHAGTRKTSTGSRPGAEERAAIEGGTPQQVAPAVAVGHSGFADDTAPAGALVAVPDGDGGWAVGETLAEAREAAGKVQGRRTTVDARPPLELPPGDWAAALRTSWVEPGYLEPDATWCEPGGEPSSPLANGGAFGGKQASPVGAAARELADRHGRPVRVLLGREDVVRLGPKRPPVAGGAAADGNGVLRVVRTAGIAAAVAAVAPGLVVEEVDVAGPPTSVDLRAAGWAEALVLLAGARGGLVPVVDPTTGAVVEAAIDPDGTVRVQVTAGDPLDEVVLRSYATGAAHMALSWVSSEGIAVDDDGVVHDLTIRSFGILRAVDTPAIEITIVPAAGPPVRAGDAVFAAVAAAAWLQRGHADGLADRHPLALTAGWQTAGMSKPMGPYTPIVRTGDWLVVSGQLGMVDGKLVNGGATAELRQAIANLEALLQGEGAALSDVVKTTVFLRHLGTDYDAVNEAYIDCFGDHRPARSCIGVAELPKGGLVEVEAWARVGAG